MRAYHDRVFERFWRRQLDIENLEALEAVRREGGGNAAGFADYLAGEGRREHDAVQEAAHEKGVFGVPSFIINGGLSWGSGMATASRHIASPNSRIRRFGHACGRMRSTLGSAELDGNGKVKTEERNDHRWRRVRYSYMDARRQARKRGLTIPSRVKTHRIRSRHEQGDSGLIQASEEVWGQVAIGFANR
jgi:2-hydroxychromene-2-carboxylate isomerase